MKPRSKCQSIKIQKKRARKETEEIHQVLIQGKDFKSKILLSEAKPKAQSFVSDIIKALLNS